MKPENATNSHSHSPENDDREVYLFPTSFSQQRLWFLDQLLPGDPTYNIHAAIQLPFAPDLPTLENSLNQIVQRHETLRTTFATQDGEPVQIIAASAPLTIEFVDLSAFGQGSESEARGLAVAEARRPFDLQHGPLVRASLIKLSSERALWLLTVHHIIADAWSMKLLLAELWETYTAALTGVTPNLPELPVQYSDFAVWQRQLLNPVELERLLAYWRTVLADAPQLDLRPDRVRPVWSQRSGDVLPLSWTGCLVAEVNQFARLQGATPFMVLLAAFLIVLQRRSQQDDLVVGMPVAGRTQAETEHLIGFFVNSLALRVDLSGDPSFRTLVERVREAVLSAMAHQDLPFERLVEELCPQRTPGRNPFFQVCFQFHNQPVGAESQNPDLLLEVHRGASVFDLCVDLWTAGDSFCGRAEYADDLFEGGTISRLLSQFRTVLQSAIADPDLPFSKLRMATAAEFSLTCIEWNRTQSDYPKGERIEQLFREQVRLNPQRIAVTTASESYSYSALDHWSDNIALRLQSAGVSEGSVVGILMGREVGAIAATLGIHKSGAAYCALDPTQYPPARLVEMVESAKICAAVTTDDYFDQACKLGLPWQLVRLPGSDATDERPLQISSKSTQASLAYVAYTSGSTGAPKGVMIPHDGVLRLVRHQNFAEFKDTDVILHHSPLGFDASTLEIWGALLNGGRIVIAPPGPLAVEEVASLLKEHEISVVWLTAGLFHQLVDQTPEALAVPRLLLAGGDVLSPSHVRQALIVRDHAPMINGYGPTEGTTFSCCHVIHCLPDFVPRVSIGRPIAATRVYVLDPHGEPCPVGVPGELVVAGDGLAVGYLNDAATTARKFVHPTSSLVQESRVYCTGDLAVWREDGTLDFLGRSDRQVKVRGFRIELAEIESTLGSHADVAQCVVQAVPDGSGDKSLVAYIQMRPGSIITSAELRARAVARLPHYAVPNRWVIVDTMPLNRNGKVDLDALAEVASDQLVSSPEALDPDDPLLEIKEVIAGIWAGVLGLSQVGFDQNFFSELGGHSLLATQVVSRVRDAFQVDLALRSLFEGATVSHMASTVAEMLLAVEAPAADEESLVADLDSNHS